MEDAYRVFAAMAASQGRIGLPEGRSVEESSFDVLAGELEAICVVDPGWRFAPNACLRRDVLAYMSTSYMGTRPGLLTGLVGVTRRYAHREMVYRGIIAPGGPRSLVSGSELLSVGARVARRTDPRPEATLTSDEIH